MEFLKVNGKKILLHLVLTQLLFLGLPGLVFLAERNSPNQGYNATVALTILAIGAILFQALYVLSALMNFYVAGMIYNAKGDTELRPLFSTKPEVVLVDQKTFSRYTTSGLTGIIDGFSVTITHRLVSMSTFDSRGIKVIIYILDHWGKPSATSKSIKVNTTFKLKLSRDIKPEILSFIDEVKQNNKPNPSIDIHNL